MRPTSQHRGKRSRGEYGSTGNSSKRSWKAKQGFGGKFRADSGGGKEPVYLCSNATCGVVSNGSGQGVGLAGAEQLEQTVRQRAVRHAAPQPHRPQAQQPGLALQGELDWGQRAGKATGRASVPRQTERFPRPAAGGLK